MTKPNTTRIAVILDRSSSMSSVAEATVEALNKFIADQRAVTTDEATLSLTQFSNEASTSPTLPLADVPKIVTRWASGFARVMTKLDPSHWVYEPHGMTRLYDTCIDVINTLGAELAAMPEDERPADVIIVVQTDGADNQSSPGASARLREMISHQQSTYNWRFIFLGANVDVDTIARTLAIPVQQTLSYNHDAAGSAVAFDVMSKSVGGYRSMKSGSRDASALSVRDNAQGTSTGN